MMHGFLSYSLIFLSTLSSIAVAEDWPQFLGPQRNGISKETNLLNQFPEDGPKVVWRSPVGVGMSGISVVGETVFTLAQNDQYQYVIAIDSKTGDHRWRSPLAPAYENTMGDGPRSTPAIDEGNVFAVSGEGILGCFSATDGGKKWSVDPVQEFGGKPAEYGVACSPILTSEHVIITVGLPKATVAAFDRSSGKIAWTAGTGNAAGYSSPTLLSLHDQVQLVVFHGQGVFGLDPKTGKELWSYPYITDYHCNIATPIAVDGNVLISAGENHGTALLNVPAKSGGEINEIWTSFGNRSIFRNEWQTSILLDGYLYGFDNIGSAGPVTNLACVEAKTGKLIWQKKRFGKGNLIAADGKLWCSTMDGELVIVAATPEKFQELGRASLIGETRQAPSLSQGRLYLRDGAEMVCVDVKK
ncbi:PQQ-binding-like beta-propeller repeat protein [Thalassoglobus sp.]|uniref:PQQ-binding-like beta-propeller repeat protein n=1 Tax=Thalassoglobus sp. TaxID=2795869 RepID=UPI003AA7BA97